MSENNPRLRKILADMDAWEGASRLDRTLYLMLKRWVDEIPDYDPENPGNFVKMFRQIDVVDEENGQGEMDLVIWHLLNCTELFWHFTKQFDEEDSDASD